MLVEGEFFCGRGAFVEAGEAEIGVVEDEGDGQRGEQKFARAEIEIEIRETQEAEAESSIGLRAPIARFPIEADFEEEQAEHCPAKRDGVGGDFVINQ